MHESRLTDRGFIRRLALRVWEYIETEILPSWLSEAVATATANTISKIVAGGGATVVFDRDTGEVTIGAPGATGAYMIAFTSDGDVALREDGSIATVVT